MSGWVTQEGDTTGAKPGEVWALTRQFVDGIAEHGYLRLHDGFRIVDGLGVPNFESVPIITARRIWPEPADQGKPQITVTEQMVERALAAWNDSRGEDGMDDMRAAMEAALGKGGER